MEILVVDHHGFAPITISPLLPGTLYHFRVRSADAAGNVAVSDDFSFTTAALPPGAAIYQASGDFSFTQGYRGWTYEDSTGTLLHPDASRALYYGHGDAWTDDNTGVFLWNDGGLPGVNGDAVRRWTAPQDGVAQITGIARVHHPAETAGTVVLIRHGATTLWQYAFTPGDDSVQTFDVITDLRQGDSLEFVTHRTVNAWNTAASTYFNPTIVLSSTDTTPPVLSSVAASNITSTAALVSWASNEASNSQVEYGPTASYGAATPLDGQLVTSHTVSLSGLVANTDYFYRVRSADAAGNLATSSGTFRTASGSAGGTTTYGAEADFSLVQGTRGWTYRDSTGAALTPDATRTDGGKGRSRI